MNGYFVFEEMPWLCSNTICNAPTNGHWCVDCEPIFEPLYKAEESDNDES